MSIPTSFRSVFLSFILLFSGIFVSAQERNSSLPFGDLHVHSVLKPRYSGEFGIWEFWEHSCPGEAFDVVLDQAENVPKFTQSNFASLMEGNVRFACVSLSPLEYGMRHPKVFKDLEKLRNTFACMGGVSPDFEFFLQERIDYYKELKEGLDLLIAGQNQSFSDEEWSYAIPKNSDELRAILADPQKLAVLLSIEGAHSLGYGPVPEDSLGLQDMESVLMRNIDFLKGIPDPHSGETFDYPMAFITLNHFMWNGLSGQAKTFFGTQNVVFDQSEGLESGMTPLGEKVIHRLIDAQSGRRILVDVKHMSIAARKWYYNLLQQKAEQGDTVPVVASHVGVCGQSWSLWEEDKGDKGKDRWISPATISLFGQDLEAVYYSHGILGLMLDKYRIGGGKAESLVNATREGSRERRKAFVHLLVANMLQVVDYLGTPKAWDIISIGSDFDGMISAMECYDRGSRMPDLSEDLLAFFQDPERIFDLYTPLNVRELMFDLSAREIVDKVMGGNLQAFLLRVLPSAPGCDGEGAY